MNTEDLKVEVFVTPNPGKDEYRIAMFLTVDSLLLTCAKDRKELIRHILRKVVVPELSSKILGLLALARLLPVDRRRRLIRQCMEEADRNYRMLTRQDIDDFLREHGEEP